MNIFPEDYKQQNIGINSFEKNAYKEPELLKEPAIDFDRGEISNTEIVYGLDAIAVRVYLTFLIKRGRWFIYFDHGSNIDTFRGQDVDYARLNVMNILKEALVDNVYITNIKDVNLYFENDDITVEFTVVSIYGEYETEQTI